MSVLKLSKNDIIRKTEQEDKIKLKRSDLSFDSARVSGWEQTNRQSIDIINDYNSRINKSEWLDKEDRAKYRSAIDSYIETTNLLRGINKTFGEGYSDEDEQKWTDSIASMNQVFADVENLYSLYESADEYKSWKDEYDFQKAINDKAQGILSAEDFAENSQYKSTYRGGEKFNAWSGMYTDTGYDDLTYDYINKDETAIGRMNLSSVMTNAGLLGIDRSELQHMEDQEISVFNYIYATEGPDAAYEYIKGITAELNARQREAYEAYYAKYANDSPVLSSIFSVITSPLKGLSYLGQAADYFNDGKIDQNAGYNKFSYTNSAIRDTVSKNIEQNWGGVGSFAYQTGMSMADFLFSSAISGGSSVVATTIMGTGAAADTVVSARDRGLNSNQAFALGTIAGVTEAVTEKYSFAALFDAAKLGENALGYVLSNALTEGSEEVTSSLINLVADVLISKNKSEWQTAINAYMASGMSESDAIWRAVADQALSLGVDFLGGFISGGVLGGAGAIANTAVKSANAKKTYGNNIQDLLIESAEIGGSNAALVDKLVDKYGKKGTLSGSDLYRLVDANDAAIKSGDKTATLSTDGVKQTSVAESEAKPQTIVSTEYKASAEDVDLVKRIATERVGKLEGWTDEVSSAMIKGYEDTKLSPDKYVAAWDEAHKLGKERASSAQLSVMPNSRMLPESVRNIAYAVGAVPGKVTKAKNNTVGNFSFDASITPEMQKAFTPQQKSEVKALQVLSKALGVNVKMFDSATSGRDENGSYDPNTRTIEVDIHAGAKREGLVLFTAAHEVTHHMRMVAKESFNKFADAVLASVGEGDMQQLVERKIEKLREKGRLEGKTETESYDLAYEEVVADAAERMLADSDALERLSKELQAKDKTLWEQFKSFIEGLIRKLKAAYAELNPDSAEANLLKSVAKDYEGILKIWSDAVVEMSQVEEMLDIDTSSESVSPVMFSERTWSESDYVIYRDQMAEKISKALGVSINKAKSYIDDINSIAKMIADDRARLDYQASSFGSAFVSNVEYGGSFDYTTLCKKRRIYTGTFSEIQKRLHDVALSPDDILKIRNLLIEEGVEATCGLCYVEGSRANMGKFAKKFIELYKRDNPSAWIPTMADVNTPDGVEKMRINHPEAYESYEYFWNHYGKLKDSDKALFASQQKPKLYEARKEYKGEILERFKGDASIEKKNLNGGIRMQSFSDFEIVHLIDTMQVIMDMSTVGLAGQAYTKVPEFAMAFGNTGLKINLSLIAKGVDSDGNLIFDDREGMPHKTAFDLRNKYSENVGTIIVTFTDEQLIAAMADSRIDFIIPFHRSQWKKGQYGAMGLPKGTKDYTYMQNEKLIKQTYHEYQGRMVKDKATNYMPNEYWDFSKSGKENAEAYLKMCAENNKRPKFYKLLDYDGNGTYSLKADGSTDGYWKLLIDFKMYDNDGIGSPQMAVTPTFNMDEATKMLDEYKGGHSSYPVAHGVVEQFISEYNKENKTKYSDRESIEDSFSNRALLANALEGVAANEVEQKRLAEYKGMVATLDRESFKLSKINAEIKELTFGKGEKNPKRLKELREEATKTANRINFYDKKLLQLEATTALKNVLKRETEKAYQRAAKKGREALHRNVEGRNKTAMRHKIKDITSELNTLLLRPTAKKHIKEELRREVAAALSAINMDTVGADERVAMYNDLIAKEKNPDVIAELTKTRDRIQLQGDTLKEKLSNLQSAYEKIKNTDDIELNLAYQEVIHNSIKAVSEKVGKTSIRNMTLEQLEMVYDLFTMIRKTIRDANKSFKEKKGLTIMQMSEAVNDQVRTVGGQPYKRNAISAALQRTGWTFLKPYVAFRTIGSITFTNMYKELRNGEDTFYGDVKEAQAFIEDQYKKHGYKSWDMKKTESFTSKGGKKFDLNLEQRMTLYAYSKREQAHKHIMEGGIVFEDAIVTTKNKLGVPVKYEVTTKDAFNLSEETFTEIANSLTAEQKAFVDEMQAYLSDTMGAKGNEVSMELLGVKLFKEKFYLPIKSSQDYMNFKAEEAGEVKLKSPAFSKETVKTANNPIVLHSFTDLWAEHINNMSMYHSFVLALEDFTRVYNYKTKTDAEAETMATKATLETAYPGVTQYINKFLKDMNGGVRGETVGMAEKLTSLSKKGAVLGSASVTIQQPSAVMRAMAMVNPKYFVTTAHKSINLAKHKQDFEELKKYAPIAGIKEMGRFDVGMGQGTVDWIKSDKTVLDKAEDILSLPPAFMDEVTWISIWNAVKRETVHTHKNLRPNSKEFLEAAGERFTDVVSLSQVYDSVFSRSDLMRNKSWIAKSLTAFMAEPTTTLNMIWDSWVQGKRTGSAKGFAKTTASVGGSIVAATVLNAALKSIVMAMRDDDEDKSYAEKYLEHLVGDLKDSINPLGLIPFAKDILSIFNGYDVERMDMALFSDLKKAIDAFDSDSKTLYEKWSGLIGATSAFFGVPVKNVERDIRGLITTIFGETEETTIEGMLNAIEEGWTGKEKSNGQQLYDAMVKGDKAQIKRIEGRFEDQSAIDSAIRKALRDNDPRMKEAAEAFLKGDTTTYNKLREEIVAEGIFSRVLVTDALKAEYNYLKQKSKEGK